MNRKIELMVCLLLLWSATIVILPRFAMELEAEEGEKKFYNPIYIKPDGTINPPEAPIQRIGKFYTLEADIVFVDSDGFIIEADNIVLNLNGHEISWTTEVYSPGPSIGVSMIGKSGVTIENCKNASGFQYGVYIRDSVNINIFNNTIFDNDIGIYSRDSREVLLDSNAVLDSSEEGVYLWHSSKHSVVNNEVSYKSVCGILAFECNNITIIANTVSNNTHGIEIRYSKDNTVDNNIVSNNTELGICVTDNSVNNTITRNAVTSNIRAGIYLADSNETKVLNNAISKNGIGIELKRSRENTVRSNTVLNSTVGVDLGDNSNENHIIANTVIWNSRAGIAIGLSASNDIDGNTVSNNFDGVLLQDCEKNEIHGNIILRNDHCGISLQYCTARSGKENNIRSNIVLNNSFGIGMANSSGNVVFTNDIMYSLWNGVELDDSRDNELVGNGIQKSGQFGISLVNSSENTIRCNTIVDSELSGIFVTNSNDNEIYYNNFIGNTQQVEGDTLAENIWDDGGSYECPVCGVKRPKGNYWSDYRGLDDGSPNQAHNCLGDRIGDTETPHLALDKYPLMAPWIPIEGDVNLDGIVDIIDIAKVAKNFGKST